jgi:Flp pilus assembly protein TadG
MTRWWRARRTRTEDAGFAALELAILFPILLIFILLIVGFGRASRGRDLVDSAAEAAARAGSQAFTADTARRAAQDAATETLTGGGVSCYAMTVSLDVSQFRPGGKVTAHLSCKTDLSDLALSGMPGHVDLTAAATSPIDAFRHSS